RSFRHDKQSSLGRNEERLGVLRPLGITRREALGNLRRGSAGLGLRHAVNSNAVAIGVVVTDVGDVDAAAGRTRGDTDVFPIINLSAHHAEATTNRPASIEREEN